MDPTWLRWEIRPWGERDGRPEGVLIFSEDITGRKRMEATLRESEATIRALLETAAQAILAVDLDGAVVLANRMAEEMFGYGRGETARKATRKVTPGAAAHTPRLTPRRVCRQSPNSSDGNRHRLAGSSERRYGISDRSQLKYGGDQPGSTRRQLCHGHHQAEASGDGASEQRKRAASACQKPAYGTGGRTPASCPGSSRRCHTAAGAAVHRDRQVGGWNSFVSGRNKNAASLLPEPGPATYPTKSGGYPTGFIHP